EDDVLGRIDRAAARVLIYQVGADQRVRPLCYIVERKHRLRLHRRSPSDRPTRTCRFRTGKRRRVSAGTRPARFDRWYRRGAAARAIARRDRELAFETVLEQAFDDRDGTLGFHAEHGLAQTSRG